MPVAEKQCAKQKFMDFLAEKNLRITSHPQPQQCSAKIPIH